MSQNPSDPEPTEAVGESVPGQSAMVRAAIEWLGQRWSTRQCPYCEAKNWSVLMPISFRVQSPKTDLEANLVPHFLVTCTNCGNTVLINAVLAGILPEDQWRKGDGDLQS